jgi:hypothetical protein
MRQSNQQNKWQRTSGERPNCGHWSYLRQRRKEIAPQVRIQILGLLMVFGDLIREGKLNASDLKGLAEDKIAHIRWEATRSNMGIC